MGFISTEMVQISTMNSEIDGGEKTSVVILDRGINRDEHPQGFRPGTGRMT